MPRRSLLLIAAVAFHVSTAPIAGAERLPLRYDAALASADLVSPAARLTINGRTAWFLFDTGAGVHVVASWFANAAGLEVDEGLAGKVHGRDATGKRVDFRGLKSLSARLDDGSTLVLPLALVADFPPEFEQQQVGGALSPQLLAGPGQAAALDLRVPELRVEPFSDAVRRLGARPLPRQRLRVCGSADDPIPNLVFAIPVEAGGGEGLLVLDTGAIATKLMAASPLVGRKRLQPGGLTWGVTGERQAYSLAPRHRLRFAGYRVRLNARVVDMAKDWCGADGLLGFDALRRCALVLGDRDVAIRCGR